jgi:hypothetical protein
MNVKEKFTTLLSDHSEYQEKMPSFLKERLEKSAKRFSENDLPSRQDESWKYTSLNAFLKDDTFILPSHDQALNTNDMGLSQWIDTNEDHLVFVNGVLRKSLSKTSDVTGVSLKSLHEGMSGEVFQKLWTDKSDDTVMEDMNLSFLNDGYVLNLDLKASYTLNLVFIHDLGRSETLYTPFQNAVNVESGASLKINEVHLFLSEASKVFSHAVTRVHLSEKAKCEHDITVIGDGRSLGLVKTEVNQAEESTYKSTQASYHLPLARVETHVKHLGERAHTDFSGLYVSSGSDQHTQKHTLSI